MQSVCVCLLGGGGGGSGGDIDQRFPAPVRQ